MENGLTRNETILLLSFVCLLFLLTSLLIYFFVLYQRRLVKEQHKKEEVEAEYQRDLLQASEQSREKEQRRIAAELHDGVGAMLSTSRMYVQQIQRLEDQEKSLEFAERADNLLGETLVSVRRIAQDLKPLVLETLGLAEAIRTLSEKVAEARQIDVEANIAVIPGLSKDRALLVFRIVQELLSNTIKHAQAKLVMLEIFLTESEVTLHYSDDGVGFDVEAVAHQKGRVSMGLPGLGSRVQLLNGEIQVESKPGEGTRVRVTFPQTEPK